VLCATSHQRVLTTFVRERTGYSVRDTAQLQRSASERDEPCVSRGGTRGRQRPRLTEAADRTRRVWSRTDGASGIVRGFLCVGHVVQEESVDE
jgi:hypothetical protein